MIGTILRNLFSNAIKFTHPGGEIVISADSGVEGLVVSVADNGIGIKKENIEKLFRIDTQFTTTGTQNEEGTGLGLILCKEFINKHNGTIWVESEEGKGSDFKFWIPSTTEPNRQENPRIKPDNLTSTGVKGKSLAFLPNF